MIFKFMNPIRLGLGVVLLSLVGEMAGSEFYGRFPTVIFDCDGVLVDTEYVKFSAWQDALKSFGVDFTIEEYMPLVGHSSKNILKMISQSKGLELSDQVIAIKNERYKTLQEQGVKAIQPMVDFAKSLANNKDTLEIQLGLASSASRNEIFINLERIGLEKAFDLVISGSDDLGDYVDVDGKNKPKPYIYIEAAKRLNVTPEQCLVFEDTKAGVDAAADAGMTVVAVPNPFTLNHDFSKASMVISSYEELPCIEVFQH